MFLVDIYDMYNGWMLVVALQMAVLSLYYLWCKKRSLVGLKNISKKEPLDWTPKPLIEHDVLSEETPIMGKIDDNTLNIGATSFLNLEKEQSIMDGALKSYNKYGVGSCGPRGFFGTIDVHLDLEKRLADFLQVEETCVYSYGFSTIASAIPSYSKKGDVIFADEQVWFAIQKGMEASRSEIISFRHNDMDHLEELLSKAEDKKKLNPRRRAFLVAEAVYMKTGEICPLPRLVELARRFKLRIMLDESLSIGVLGANGRGLTEHFDVPRDEIDLIMGSLEHSFATIGGFCAGTHFIVEHQRLSGLGYCFSASLPPMLTQAAINSLDVIEAKPEIMRELQTVSRKLSEALSHLKHYRVKGDLISPIKHVYLKIETSDALKHSYLRNIANYCLSKGIAMAVAAYLWDAEANCPEPSIRIASSRKLTNDVIDKICLMLDEAYESVGPKADLTPRAK